LKAIAIFAIRLAFQAISPEFFERLRAIFAIFLAFPVRTKRVH